MRILYILTSLGIGGAEKQVVSLAAHMAAKGHVVAFLVLKQSSEEWPIKLPALRLNLASNPLSIYRGIRFARNFISLFRPDILHSHTFPANMFARILRLSLRVKGSAPACINTIHNVHEGGLHRMAAYALTSWWVDRVTAVSTAASNRFVRLGAVPKRKMSVITNGIDTEEFAPDTKRRKLVRRQMNLGTDFVWLAAGRLVSAKDYPNLLRSFQGVLEREPSVRLWIAGEGDIQALFASHPDLTTDLPSIQWLGLRRDMADLLDAADGFVLSSAWEGMPLVVGEAMSMGKPVVATNVGGVSELMGITGILVPPADHRALAAAMSMVIGWSDLERKRAAIDARTRIVSLFSIDARVEMWESYYEETLAERGHD